jgi:hypothetical protein
MNIVKNPGTIHKMVDGSSVILHSGENCECNPELKKSWERTSRSWVVTHIYVHNVK